MTSEANRCQFEDIYSTEVINSGYDKRTQQKGSERVRQVKIAREPEYFHFTL